MSATAYPSACDTMADVLRALGDVSRARVLWKPVPGTATEADLVRVNEREPKQVVELLDGVLVDWGEDVLDGGELLPGFTLALPVLFGYLDTLPAEIEACLPR